MERNLTKKIVSIITILALALTMSVVPITLDGDVYAANPANNKIVAPAKVVAGKAFDLSLIGDEESKIGSTTGERKIIPDYWQIKTSKQTYNGKPPATYYFDNLPVQPYIASVKVDYPGKYKIEANFYESEFNYNNGFSYWKTDYNVGFKKSQDINVQGTVKFSISSKKGKLKKKSQKSRYVTQKTKVGTLPKVKAKKGYKFKGWYTKKTGGKKIKKSTKVNFTKATKTYYAQFKKI